MLTTDFTGTYDYEKEEAQHAAGFILDDLASGYITPEELPDRINRELVHWKRCLPDTFDDFQTHFSAAIEAGKLAAISSYRQIEGA